LRDENPRHLELIFPGLEGNFFAERGVVGSATREDAMSLSAVSWLISCLLVFAQGEKHVEVERATFGAGCFWCVEAVFSHLDGVFSVEAGYAGGTTPNPTYEQVSTGTTGHAEVARITFDPARISYERLLEVFWEAHDPTSLNRQGADRGTQYRSVIFYHDKNQKETADRSRANAQKGFSRPIVTEIKPIADFFRAENYHQDYYAKNPGAPYCVFVIKPKLDKLKLK
jgi:peptide-methionine (S)-S-oxide reductase